ncbi:ComEC family competence protein [Labrenzia aggregata]|uniref:ComEC family competence protein n=1 Tax=Roseibium aggregatum TaxID=187304 RepID=A0A939EFT2_9HYPH|nr:ComEC family competence protein [Roseibium aggregatum]
MPEDPFWPLLVFLWLSIGVVAAWQGRGRSLGRPVLFAFAVVSGLTAGAVRTSSVDAPRLAEAMNVTVTGHIAERVRLGSALRLLLKVETADGRSRDEVLFPEYVRVRVPKETDARVGDLVRVRARLFPPSGPVSPGGYDFSFRAYFSQIGATGFSYGAPETIGPGDTPFRVSLAARVQGVRDFLSSRIRNSLAGHPEAELAVALLVGERSGISEEQEDNLRAAGLAHILAISGLHMALFAGGAYSACYLLLALVPSWTLRWPTHKWAALIALSAAFAYLVVSGAAVATQRSFLMIALVFFGVLFGRRGLTLRSVALAGLFLLLLAPERLFFPGFQMSFAAVICLVAVYDVWRRRERLTVGQDAMPGTAGRIGRFLFKWGAGVFVTALVAGLATGIVGAHHFGRIAPFGLLGNLLGMPVFTLLVMPAGALALVLMPFGLAWMPLVAMSYGLSILLDIAEFTAGLGEGAGSVGRLSAFAAFLLLSALFLALLLPGRRRLTAAIPLILGVVLVAVSRPPDILVAASGTLIAARDETGTLRHTGRRDTFASELWLQDEGVSSEAITSRKMKSPQLSCDPKGCVAFGHGGAGRDGSRYTLVIATPKLAGALESDCRFGDIIVSDLIAPEACGAALLLDRKIRKKRGAVAIWLSLERENESTTKGAGPVDRGRSETRPNGVKRPRIEKVVFAIPDPPRPWHRPGDVTRTSLRRQSRAPR